MRNRSPWSFAAVWLDCAAAPGLGVWACPGASAAMNRTTPDAAAVSAEQRRGTVDVLEAGRSARIG
jgi:hypothetical protein